MANYNDVIIQLDPIEIPDNATYTHKSTSYIVSRNRDFTDIVVSKNRDEENLTSLTIPATTLGTYTNLYVKVKVWFSDDSSLPWTTVDLNTNQSNINFSDNVVCTPTVTIDDADTDVCTIKHSVFKMCHGVGEHKSSSYRIETLSGKIVFEKLLEESNKDMLPIGKSDLQTILEQNKVYMVRVKHHTNTGSSSNWGGNIMISDSKKLYRY